MDKEFIERRHMDPDYDLDLHITGIVLGTTGKVHWKIHIDDCISSELAADILERAIEVLRQGTTDLVPPQD